MLWHWWYLIIIAIFLILIIRLINLKRHPSISSGNIMDRAKSRMQKLGDCCRRIFSGA